MTDLLTIETFGPARDRGRTYGEAARPLIHAGVEAWLESVEAEVRMKADAYFAAFLNRTAFSESMREWTPWVLEEIQGIAEGATLPFETILAYNLPDEEWCYRQSTGAGGEPFGCSVIGLREGPRGTPIASQNMDTPAYYAGTQALYKTTGNGPETTVLVYAGSTGICGFNAAGVSICCNAMLTLPNATHGLPVNCVVRGVLAQSSLEAARAFAESVPHASGQAYLIGGSDGLVGLECSPEGCKEYGRDQDRLWHTNHSTIATHEGEVPAPPDEGEFADSTQRGRFLEQRLPSIVDQGSIEAALSDRTVPICRVPTGPSDAITFGSIVIELTVPPRVTLAPGPPDRTPYREIS
jgi:hypothetical protein